MTSQRFCLRWNNHQSNLLSVFDQLLQDESFVDVTLAVDGRNLKAHKIVLSACSPYFQALFVGHPDRHPIVILKDIPYVDMRSLLDFMYRGEVSVDQDRLTMFLKVAESLRIKGLTEASGDNCDTLAKMGSTLTPTSHPYSALGYPQSRLKRPLSGSQHSLNSLQASNPLLGSALTGPKRKRGLPRKLSGSVSSGLDVMADVPDGEEEGEEEEEGREEDEEFDEERSVQSDSDMIERAHSPFDNKMLEVNVSEGKPAAPSPQGDSSSACNMEERGEGAGSPPCPSPQREEDEEKQASQELATNVKKERETEASGAVDQNDRNSSPVPERFPPGYLQHLLKLKTLDISRRVYDSVFRPRVPPSLVPPGELPKDLSRPTTRGPLPLGYPGLLAGGFPAMTPGVFPLVALKPNVPTTSGNVGNEETTATEVPRNLTNMNDDKFYEDMISCSDEDVDEEFEDNNNDYDDDMRKYELSSYKMLEKKRREDESCREEPSGRVMGSRTDRDHSRSTELFPRTNMEYRGDLGELTIETTPSCMSAIPGTSTKPTGVSPSGRSRKHHGSSSSIVPISGASTSATSPRDRSFIDKASVRQFCTQEGEHIFRCNICLKTYTHISNFCRHFLSAHDDRYKQEISCPVCFKMFTRRDNMMTHTKQVHRITLMRGTLQPVYLDGENGAASQGGGNGVETTGSSATATSTS